MTYSYVRSDPSNRVFIGFEEAQLRLLSILSDVFNRKAIYDVVINGSPKASIINFMDFKYINQHSDSNILENYKRPSNRIFDGGVKRRDGLYNACFEAAARECSTFIVQKPTAGRPRTASIHSTNIIDSDNAIRGVIVHPDDAVIIRQVIPA